MDRIALVTTYSTIPALLGLVALPRDNPPRLKQTQANNFQTTVGGVQKIIPYRPTPETRNLLSQASPQSI